MSNRISISMNEFEVRRDEFGYNWYYNAMVKCEEISNFIWALKENNHAYWHAFRLYTGNVNRLLQLQRLDELMKKSELYLRKLNLDGTVA